ncbi:hypothetical protein L249_8161 [Ophiocordyceps polyrhachis-furcata BCC 54312]|uniref:Uncharacterized protein n=1 Tax=Ophiocordyceps polyrhachis-furcata BCC 54312 TaxID=1330021 RepID=A0A367LHP1_9HYPO|nr:hypothetical protein L249_8161 [Ophiocordyceps polyrhachis-furcata BCC 54312]
MISMQLVIGPIIQLRRLVLNRILSLDELDSRVAATDAILRPRIVAHRLDNVRVSRQKLRIHDMLHLLSRQQSASQPSSEDGDAARRCSGREADEGTLEDPTAHAANQVGVLFIARQRQDLSSAHGVTHDEDRQTRRGRPLRIRHRELVTYEGGDIGHYLGRRARQPLLPRLGDAPSPSPLIPRRDLDAVPGQQGEEVVVAVDVLAEAVDEDELGLDGDALGLPSAAVLQ